jgi:transposase-like protein
MAHIVAGIVTLIQYLAVLKNEPKMLRPERCPSCGKFHPWIHGSYPRKADRSCDGDEFLNPIIILRFYCSGCGKTCSILPECIPSRRWYLWQVQESALLLLLAGKSINLTAKEVGPSRSTIRRWLDRFNEQLSLHKDALCKLFADFGRFAGFSNFWKACLQQITLAQAMRLCHADRVLVP